MKNIPSIAVIIPTYNRASTLIRCIDSVLAQTYSNLEIIIVNDGSTDETTSLLDTYLSNERVRVIQHDKNQGVCAAINTGFENIEADWFTLIGSDDEMIPDAIEKMIEIPQTIDDTITAITCNCLDTTTGEFSGKGLSKSGYITAIDIMQKCSGEHWGITKTELLGSDRLDERISGGEGVLWHKISKRAKRYYLHEALRIYHTEGEDRLCSKKPLDLKKEIKKHAILSTEEHEYIEDLKQYSAKRYFRHRMYYGMYCSLVGNRKQKRIIMAELAKNRQYKNYLCLLYVSINGIESLQKLLCKVS